MMGPVVLTLAIMAFVAAWNEFLFALILTRTRVVPLSVGIMSFRLERGDLWELISATGILIAIPMFFLAMMIQRHFIKGMTAGAIR